MKAPRRRPDKELHVQARQFCQAHLGRHCFAPLTGTDWPTWCAFVYLLRAWASSGGDAAVSAMRATTHVAQAKTDVMELFVQAIPAVLDWSHADQLWPLVAPLGFMHLRPVHGGDS